MTDKEWMKNIKNISNKELFDSLEHFGFDSYYKDLWYATVKELKRRLKRSKGRWKKTESIDPIYACSCCDWHSFHVEHYKFCPNCGADMRGKEKVVRPLDKSKKSNIKCEHCKYYGSSMPEDGICFNPDSPKSVCFVNYWNRCKFFEWSDRYKGQ